LARIKGVNVVPVVKYLRTMDAAARSGLDPSLHHYLEGRILVSSWYPESEVHELMRTLAKLMPMPEAKAWFTLGLRGARTQAEETYRGLFEAKEVVRVVRHVNVLWRSHHDTGELRAAIDGDTRALLELTDYELLTAGWCDLMTGFFVGMVEGAGAQKPRCELLDFDRENRRASWQLSWTP